MPYEHSTWLAGIAAGGTVELKHYNTVSDSAAGAGALVMLLSTVTVLPVCSLLHTVFPISDDLHLQSYKNTRVCPNSCLRIVYHSRCSTSELARNTISFVLENSSSSAPRTMPLANQSQTVTTPNLIRLNADPKINYRLKSHTSGCFLK